MRVIGLTDKDADITLTTLRYRQALPLFGIGLAVHGSRTQAVIQRLPLLPATFSKPEV